MLKQEIVYRGFGKFENATTQSHVIEIDGRRFEIVAQTISAAINIAVQAAQQ